MNGQQDVGSLIREARELSGTTASQFAALLRVSSGTVSHLERDFGPGSNDLVLHALQLCTRLLAEKYGVSHEKCWTRERCIEELRMVIVFSRAADLQTAIQSLPPSAGA